MQVAQLEGRLRASYNAAPSLAGRRDQKMKSYRELKVWQTGIEIAHEVYRLAERLPHVERFGLVSQMKRAAISIPANIAHGHERETTNEFLHCISSAFGSIAELETHCYLAVRLGYVGMADCQGLLDQLDEQGKMLRGLQKALFAGRYKS